MSSGINPDELKRACDVLQRAISSPDLLISPEFRLLRQAVTPLVETQAQKVAQGISLSNSRKRTQNPAAHDEQAKASTGLRKGRKRLAEKTVADCPESLPFLPNLLHDGCVSPTSLPSLADGAAFEDPGSLRVPQQCYVCKQKYQKLHHFYDRLCQACGDLNFAKRNQTGDLSGFVAVVTGGRVKIGFRIVLKLLRAGATVVTTTRFPHDAVARFAAVSDAESWKGRLHIVGVDFRSISDVEAFAASVNDKFHHVDILINNACQTIRRPAAFYDALRAGESSASAALPDYTSTWLLSFPQLAAVSGHTAEDRSMMVTSTAVAPLSPPLPTFVHSEDVLLTSSSFPAGAVDVTRTQLDLRPNNSWTLRLCDVETPELAEVFAINAIAPFVLCAKLKLSMQSPFLQDGVVTRKPAFIVNVSSMEGKFDKFKSMTHPHTNMAKAALNMMTLTSARDFALVSIFMTAVDTGWVTDELPIAVQHAFSTPIDEEDGAARVLDPIFSYVNADPKPAAPLSGVFLKDYKETTW